MFAGCKTPGALLAEVRAAEAARERRLRTRKERLERIAGPYQAADSGDEYDPENALYEYICYVLPRAAFSNPDVLVKSKRPELLTRAVAKAMQDGLSRMTHEQKMWRTFRTLCVDYLLDYAVAMVSPEPREGMTAEGRPVWWPQMYRIDPRCYFEDPLPVGAPRFQGHVMLRDLDGLIEEAEANPDDWHVENVKALAEESGVDVVQPERKGVPARGQVAIYEVFVPEDHGAAGEDPDDGFSGTIYTLGAAQGEHDTLEDEADEKAWSLRRPRKFYGPRSGPFVTAKFLENEHVHLGMSPTLAAEGSMRELAAAGRANNRAARRYKRVVGVVGGDQTTSDLLDAEDGYSVPLSGEGSLTSVEMGGVSASGIQHLDMRRNSTDRLLGMDDIQRGMVTGDGTATEASLASASSDARTNDVVAVFRRFVSDIYEALAWYCYHDDRVVIGVKGQVPGMVQPMLRGGPMKGMTFDDLQFEIAPFAMEPETPATRRARADQMMSVIGWLGQAIPSAPFMDWGRVLPELGSLLGIDGLENFIDIQGAAEWGAQMAQFGGEQGSTEPPQASLGRNTAGKPLGGVTLKLGAKGGRKEPAGAGAGGTKVKAQQLGGGA